MNSPRFNETRGINPVLRKTDGNGLLVVAGEGYGFRVVAPFNVTLSWPLAFTVDDMVEALSLPDDGPMPLRFRNNVSLSGLPASTNIVVLVAETPEAAAALGAGRRERYDASGNLQTSIASPLDVASNGVRATIVGANNATTLQVWNALGVLAGAVSTAFNNSQLGALTVMGNVSAATTIFLQHSPDGVTYYSSSSSLEQAVLAGAGDFGFSTKVGSGNWRLKTSNAVTVTAWFSLKF